MTTTCSLSQNPSNSILVSTRSVDLNQCNRKCVDLIAAAPAMLWCEAGIVAPSSVRVSVSLCVCVSLRAKKTETLLNRNLCCNFA